MVSYIWPIKHLLLTHSHFFQMVKLGEVAAYLQANRGSGITATRARNRMGNTAQLSLRKVNIGKNIPLKMYTLLEHCIISD